MGAQKPADDPVTECRFLDCAADAVSEYADEGFYQSLFYYYLGTSANRARLETSCCIRTSDSSSSVHGARPSFASARLVCRSNSV